MLTIHFVVETPFSRRDYQRLGIELLRGQGFKVAVVDATNLVNPVLVGRATVESFDGGLVRTFSRLGELGNYLRDCVEPRDWVVLMIGLNLNSLGVFRALRKCRGSVCNLNLGTLLLNTTTATHAGGNIRRVLKGLRQPRKIANFLLNKSPETFGVRGVDVTLADGSFVTSPRGPARLGARVIHAHSFDYDTFLGVKDAQDKVVNGSYAVFLDEYLPFHPDFARIRAAPPCTAEEYFPLLDALFREIESSMGLQVVIAAHPRSDYASMPMDYYRGRKIIKGRTAELVRDSQLVLVHASTAINFAILFRRPLVFLGMSEFSRFPLIERHINALAEFFEQGVLNLSARTGTDLEFKPPNLQKYLQFQDRVIKKTGTEEVPLWQIFADFLHSSK